LTSPNVKAGKIWTAADREDGADLECDVCIVGSGAGGAVTASVLAEAGLSVVILESGGHYKREDFDLDERKAYTRLYQDRALRTTADSAITVLQGKSVGGGTTVNWTTCFRTPGRILEHWQQAFGLDVLTEQALAPHFDHVEAQLSISPWIEALANENNRVIADGCAKLGWESSVVNRNVLGCANSGYCGLGCPYDAKQGMLLTTIPKAIEAGAQLIPRAQVQKLNVAKGRVQSVLAHVLHDQVDRPTGATITVRPTVTVLSGGALNTPALLLRSGLNVSGRVGKRTFLHPVVSMIGRYKHRIDGYYGAPQSITSHEFVDRGTDVGFFIETAPLQPMLAATAMMNFGPSQAAFMRTLPHMSGLLALLVDGLDPDARGGTVSLHADGRPKLDYDVSPPLIEAMKEAHYALARIHLAAGATEAGTLHRNPIFIRDESELSRLEDASYGPFEHGIFSAHQMGGCAMSGSPDRGVVDTEHRVRGWDDLYVVDGSVLPTALGVNPSETIYALAHRAASRLVARRFEGSTVGESQE